MVSECAKGNVSFHPTMGLPLELLLLWLFVPEVKHGSFNAAATSSCVRDCKDVGLF